MKYFMIAMLLLFSTANASVEKAPAPLTDSKIERKLQDGTIQKFDGNEYMIVKRVPKKKPVVVTCPTVTPTVITTTITKTEIVEKLVTNKNRVSLLAGKGTTEGLDISTSGSTATIESNVGFVGGLQYQRLLTDRVSVGGQLQTNKSAFLGLGLDF
jgi:hypothetical protein